MKVGIKCSNECDLKNMDFGIYDQERKQIALSKLTGDRWPGTDGLYAAEVELPLQAPEIYSPMSWSEARQCEQLGMTFGPHTVTHPILANTSDEQSAFEIEESWRRVAAEVKHPVPVFCYPNGQPTDFGEREVNTIARVGLRGAVVGSGGYARGDTIRGEQSRFRIRCFGMPGDLEGFADLIQFVKGIERIKEGIRGARA